MLSVDAQADWEHLDGELELTKLERLKCEAQNRRAREAIIIIACL